MNASNISTGDIISIAGNNSTLINRSTVTSALNQVKNDNGEAVANALNDLTDYIDQAGSKTASAHLELLMQELARRPDNPGIKHTLWNGIVAAIPAIASLPAAVAFVTNVIQR